MMLMSSYGTLEKVGDDKNRIWKEDNTSTTKETTFKYPELVYNHFQYRDAVDAHNSSRMFPVALEESWKTQRWPCRVLSFLLAITEVNCRLVLTNIYKQPPYSQQDFRKRLAKEFLYNAYLNQQEPSGARKSARLHLPEHRLVSLPKHRTFKKQPWCTVKLLIFSLYAMVVANDELGHTAPVLQEEQSVAPVLQITFVK